jgi:V8-like Glu-specific endopeptidase
MVLMKWSQPALKALREKLAALYDERPAQKVFLQEVGWSTADLTHISWHPAPLYCWFNIIEWANARGKVGSLVQKLKTDFPDDIEIQAIEPNLVAQPVVVPPLSTPWGGSALLEKELSAIPTLVLVDWLAVGLERAKAVGRVNLPSGYGTGFLVRGRNGDLLLTNHHVLDSAGMARTSTVTFNFEEKLRGGVSLADEWKLEPNRFWTSPVTGGDDWTTVGVQPRIDNGKTIRATDLYGALDISPTPVKINDRVNIIQHPGGLAKKISCVSNVVAWVGKAEGRIQYLTDTQPGSSGAPVFNNDWKVVALHHSGGSLLAGSNTTTRYLRNEGIDIQRIYDQLVAVGEL